MVRRALEGSQVTKETREPLVKKALRVKMGPKGTWVRKVPEYVHFM